MSLDEITEEVIVTDDSEWHMKLCGAVDDPYDFQNVKTDRYLAPIYQETVKLLKEE